MCAYVCTGGKIENVKHMFDHVDSDLEKIKTAISIARYSSTGFGGGGVDAGKPILISHGLET